MRTSRFRFRVSVFSFEFRSGLRPDRVRHSARPDGRSSAWRHGRVDDAARGAARHVDRRRGALSLRRGAGRLIHALVPPLELRRSAAARYSSGRRASGHSGRRPLPRLSTPKSSSSASGRSPTWRTSENPAENLVGIAQSASQGAITARQLDVRPVHAGGRGARDGAGRHHHAAQRRGKSQPVLPARLQPRSRQRLRDDGRGHAGRTCRRTRTARAIPTSTS